MLRATAPGYLVQVRALFVSAHTPLPPQGLVGIAVMGYAEPSMGDLWSSELVAAIGNKRPRSVRPAIFASESGGSRGRSRSY